MLLQKGTDIKEIKAAKVIERLKKEGWEEVKDEKPKKDEKSK